jgi:DNA-binding beta-propeller fold protein YncE
VAARGDYSGNQAFLAAVSGVGFHGRSPIALDKMSIRIYRPFDMPCRYILLAAFMAAICVVLSGCAGHADVSGVHQDIFWPKPPEIKRIEFVNAVSKPEDLNIRPGILKRLVNFVSGKEPVSIVSPYGITTDAKESLYVVDTVLKRIHVFDRLGSQYFFFPADVGMLASPVGIAIDKNDTIYVTDSKRAVVYIFKDSGKTFVSTLGRDIFKRPTGIVVNPKTSELLVVDTLLSQVFRFDLSNRLLKGSFGTDGAAAGQFHYPTNISVTSTGDIIVSDSLNFRVQVFSPEGRFLFTFGSMGDVPGTFSRPKGVAADSDGNIYAVDGLFDNVQIFDKRGRLLMAFGEHGAGYGNFWLPTGIYIDNNDLIYVSDSSNRRVQIFKYLKEDMVK